METEPILEVLHNEEGAYLPFTPLVKAYKGKWVQLVEVPRPVDLKESEMEYGTRIAFTPRIVP
jgi:hypothetical protein